MRKTPLILFALVLFQFGCEPHEVPRPGPVGKIDYAQVSDGFHEMFEGAFRLTEHLPLISVVDRNQNEIKIRYEAENVSQATTQYFINHFNGSPLRVQKVYFPIPRFNSNPSLERSIIELENIIDTSDVLSEMQGVLIMSLSKEISKIETYAEGFEVLDRFRETIINSIDLSENDRILLLEVAAASKALLGFLKKGGVPQMQARMLDRLGSKNPFGRAMGCSLDWRSIWMDGVVGLVGGAVYGGYIGATAGTFTVPVLGTAAGAVGGAVFGGASGFISGVSYGIASDLLTTCFRSQTSLQQTYASCDLAWTAYVNNEITELPIECFEVSIPIKNLEIN